MKAVNYDELKNFIDQLKLVVKDTAGSRKGTIRFQFGLKVSEIIEKLESLKVREVLPLFKYEINTQFSEFDIDKCHAGIVYPENYYGFGRTEQGQIGYETYGARDTFSIGMPMYNQQGEFIGRLGVGFYKHLDYENCDKLGNKIPSYFWKVIGYEGDKTVRPLTYYQQLKRQEK